MTSFLKLTSRNSLVSIDTKSTDSSLVSKDKAEKETQTDSLTMIPLRRRASMTQNVDSTANENKQSSIPGSVTSVANNLMEFPSLEPENQDPAQKHRVALQHKDTYDSQPLLQLKVFDHVIQDADRTTIEAATSSWPRLKSGYMSISRDFVWKTIFVQIMGTYLFLYDVKGDGDNEVKWSIFGRKGSRGTVVSHTLIMYCSLSNATLRWSLNDSCTSIECIQIDILDKADIRIATLLLRTYSSSLASNETDVYEYKTWAAALQMAGCVIDVSDMEKVSHLFEAQPDVPEQDVDSLLSQGLCDASFLSKSLTQSQKTASPALSMTNLHLNVRFSRRRSSTLSQSAFPLYMIKENFEHHKGMLTREDEKPLPLKPTDHDIVQSADLSIHQVGKEIIPNATVSQTGDTVEQGTDLNGRGLRLLKESFASFRFSQSLKYTSGLSIPTTHEDKVREMASQEPAPSVSGPRKPNVGIDAVSNTGSNAWSSYKGVNGSTSNVTLHVDHPEDLFGPSAPSSNSKDKKKTVNPKESKSKSTVASNNKDKNQSSSGIISLNWNRIFPWASRLTSKTLAENLALPPEEESLSTTNHRLEQATRSPQPVFRMPLQHHLSLRSTRCKNHIPSGFLQVLVAIEELGLSAEGVYRISGNGTTVARLRSVYLEDPWGFSLRRSERSMNGGFVKSLSTLFAFKVRGTGASGNSRQGKSQQLMRHGNATTVGFAMEGRSKRMSSLSSMSDVSSKRSSIPLRTSWDVPDPIRSGVGTDSIRQSLLTITSKRQSMMSSPISSPVNVETCSQTATATMSNERRTSFTSGIPLTHTTYASELFDHDVHVLASFMKRVLREGVIGDCGPVFPYEYYRDVLQIVSDKVTTEEAKVSSLKSIIHSFPDFNYALLEILLRHLRNILTYSDINLMSPEALSVIFGPTLLQRPPFDERILAQHPDLLLQACIRDAKLTSDALLLLLNYVHNLFG